MGNHQIYFENEAAIGCISASNLTRDKKWRKLQSKNAGSNYVRVASATSCGANESKAEVREPAPLRPDEVNRGPVALLFPSQDLATSKAKAANCK
jgi:hypothetical protein